MIDKATKVARLRAKGLSYIQIGNKLGMSSALVGYYVKKGGMPKRAKVAKRRASGGTIFQKSAAALREKASELTKLADAIASL